MLCCYVFLWSELRTCSNTKCNAPSLTSPGPTEVELFRAKLGSYWRYLRNNSGNYTYTSDKPFYLWKRLVHHTNYTSYAHYRESKLNIPPADISTYKCDRSYG